MMPNVVFFLQFLVAVFSLLAGGFWMASAYGRTVGNPWQQSHPVPPADLMDHQTRWNGRAALCASLAAIAQALSFVFDHYALLVTQFH
jgi:hypothetical protein